MALLRKRFHKPGTAPGTLASTGPRRAERVRIQVICYGPQHLEEKEVASVAELAPYRAGPHVAWINIEGLDAALLGALGDLFELHPLALEDVLNTGQRPKIEDYPGHQFLVVRSLDYDGGLEAEQISFFLGDHWVITVQEIPGDSFDPVRDRIRTGGRGRIRHRGPDYLAYALLDALVDEFFPVLETLGERIEELEDELVTDPSPHTIREVHHVKRDLLVLRRAAYPEREVIHAMEREDCPQVTAETRVFLRDTYDHTIQVMDMIETYRELAGGMVDVYLSSLSNRMNEVMKVLTVISTIFIPLTFIAGIWGMNFDPDSSPLNMPELRWFWGYPTALLLMAAIAGALVVFFKRKGWL
ncbi:MAG TPA: magnesium/cobalt transporter CorA [Thermoanaerobaculia bacterium]|nr:magnesium/cobalt transporter CorA [Thermoanaerobaculia bacterium]